VRGNNVATALSQAGTPTTFVAADLADTTAPARLVDECISRFGRIDALVNAAGLTNRASFLDADLDDWAALFAVNARAPFFLMQAAITQMRKQGQGGAIVNVLSINAHCGSPELAVYSATKGALATLTRNAANAHRFDRIRVNGINVGWTDTPAERIMQAETLGHGPGWIDAANASQPFGRLLAADEVANLAVFLLSDASGPMTGALIDQEQWVVGANR
jgi:NAD(P)-dependent dehydrogenase (short-subunit alcohol dehydrogenase family)